MTYTLLSSRLSVGGAGARAALCLLRALALAFALVALQCVTISAVRAEPASASVEPIVIAQESIAAPVILLATVKKESRVPADRAPGLPANGRRTLVSVDVERVLKAPGPVPPRVHYLVDWVPADGGEGPPKLKKQSVLLFLRPSATRDDHYILASRRGQQPGSAEAAALALGYAQQDVSPPVEGFRPQRITGVFAWGETRQFLLRGQDQRQITLDLVPADGTLVATFDDVGLVREEIAPQSLMWVLLQCTLPARLEEAVIRSYTTDGLNPAAAYARLREQLGPCGSAGPAS